MEKIIESTSSNCYTVHKEDIGSMMKKLPTGIEVGSMAEAKYAENGKR